MQKLKERLDTLSDAIIAIVMTVLVLEIQIPKNLSDLWDLFLAIGLFLVTFVIIVNFWYRRLQVSTGVKKINLRSLVLDLAAHAVLCLYPLATQLLVEFKPKWVAILFFASINLLTQLLLNINAYVLVHHSLSEKQWRSASFFQAWLCRRAVIGTIFDLIFLVIALVFNTFGIYFYIFMPFAEFLTNFKRGRRMEEALNNGLTFKDLLDKRYGGSEKD